MEAAIEAQDLARSFGAVRAVDGLNLTVWRGEMFGLVGPDGAGKTTAIRLLAGLLLPDRGWAKVLGCDLLTEEKAIKRQIGYLAQQFSLYGDLTVDENIEFFARIHGVKEFADRRQELLDFTRLTPFRRRLADQLSGGMKQKLALACTLIHQPELLFLDEPTSGVDPVSRRDFWRILAGLRRRGVTLFLTTPYLDEAERCTRVGLMYAGRLIHCDEPQRIKESLEGGVLEIQTARPQAVYRELHQHPAWRAAHLIGERIRVPVADAARELAALREFLAEVGGGEIRPVLPTLEDAFVERIERQEK